jgi:hypothetical protein
MIVLHVSRQTHAPVDLTASVLLGTISATIAGFFLSSAPAHTSAACFSAATRGSISSSSMAFFAWVKMQSAARKRWQPHVTIPFVQCSRTRFAAEALGR